MRPVRFFKRLATSAVPGFEPVTFGSQVPSFAHVATEAAWIKLLKLKVILPLLFLIVFPCCFA